MIQEEAHLNIPIYPEITSGVQPHRHLVTYHLRENLEKELDELVQQGIVEKVDAPSL